MHQATTMNERVERGMRLLAVVSLACTLTAFGCTTNRTPASPTTTPGSSSGAVENLPMASSAIPIDPTRPSSVDALAVLAADQAYQGRVLGKVNPDGAQSTTPTPPTGVFVNPAVVVNPLTTVNSSISSAEIGPGITGGAVGGVAVAVMTPAATNSAIPSTSNAAIAATSNATIASVPSQSALATASTPKASATKATASKATTTRKKARATAAVKTSTTVTTAQPVRLETNPTGEVVVTNTNPPKQ